MGQSPYLALTHARNKQGLDSQTGLAGGAGVASFLENQEPATAGHLVPVGPSFSCGFCRVTYTYVET